MEKFTTGQSVENRCQYTNDVSILHPIPKAQDHESNEWVVRVGSLAVLGVKQGLLDIIGLWYS